MALSRSELKERWRREELCTNCGSHDALPDRSECSKCKAGDQRRYRARIASGVCRQCPDPAEDGLTHCATHREEQNAYWFRSQVLLRSVT